MELKQKVKKTVKTLFMSCPAFLFHIINLTVSMVLNPGYPVESPEAFNKHIDTRIPLPESDFIGVEQRPGTGDSRMFPGEILGTGDCRVFQGNNRSQVL